jgi:hypothetical protein
MRFCSSQGKDHAGADGPAGTGQHVEPFAHWAVVGAPTVAGERAASDLHFHQGKGQARVAEHSPWERTAQPGYVGGRGSELNTQGKGDALCRLLYARSVAHRIQRPTTFVRDVVCHCGLPQRHMRSPGLPIRPSPRNPEDDA